MTEQGVCAKCGTPVGPSLVNSDLLEAAKNAYWLISEEQMFKVRPECIRALEQLYAAITKAEGDSSEWDTLLDRME